MKIAIGADSAGKPLLDVIAAHLKGKADLEVSDLSQSGFYADLSQKLAQTIVDGDNERGILFCGTGIGVCISANKVPGIRAALTHDTYSAERAAKVEQRPDHHHGRARHRAGAGEVDRRYLARLRIRRERPVGRQCRRDRSSRRGEVSEPTARAFPV